MIRWEYRREPPHSDMNALGAEGWELCAYTPSGMAVFKRRVPPTDWPLTGFKSQEEFEQEAPEA